MQLHELRHVLELRPHGRVVGAATYTAGYRHGCHGCPTGLDCYATRCWGTDQSALLCPSLDIHFNFDASLCQAGTVAIHIHFTEIHRNV